MNKYNVCMVVNNLDVGGLEKVVISLLNEFNKNVFRMHLICLDGPGKLYKEVDVPESQVLILNKSFRAMRFGPVSINPWIFRKIRHFISKWNIHIVHTHNAAPLVYAGIASMMCSPRPIIVYSEHNQFYSATPNDRRKFGVYLRLADQVVAVSNDLKKTFMRELNVRCPIRVIHNGIDGSRFKNSCPSKIREELSVHVDEFLVGTGVVLTKQKGIAYLIKAAKLVGIEDPKVRFVIAGEGPLRMELEKYAKHEGIGDRFSFLGYRNDIPDFISALDLYVLPSLWEGLPLALLEALAIGKPIVATHVGGNPEIVEDSVNGYLVPPGDAISLAKSIMDVRRSQDFVAIVRENNILKFSKLFSLEAMIKSHEDLFLNIVSKKN